MDEIIKFNGEIEFEAEKAYLISVRNKEIWIDKKDIKDMKLDCLGLQFIFSIPVQVAIDKGIKID